MLATKIFAEGVAEQIKDYLPPEFQDMECRVMEQQKNNGVMRVGINCLMPDSQTAPLIYMEPYYDMVRKGDPLNDIMEMIAHEVETSNKIRFTIGETHMESYDVAKDYLSVRLVNTKANRRMLMEVPHMDMDDLSAVCRVEIPVPGGEGIGSIQITNSILERWGVGKEELFECAMKNMQELNPPFMVDMDTALWGSFSGDFSMQDNLLEHAGSMDNPSNVFSMYVLTTKNKSNGAATMMCPGVMEKISDMFPKGFYILPSSIHELIILPKSETMEPKELGEMVREINRQQVDKEERLSDHVYEYDKEQGRVCSVPESVERIKEVER